MSTKRTIDPTRSATRARLLPVCVAAVFAAAHVDAATSVPTIAFANGRVEPAFVHRALGGRAARVVERNTAHRAATTLPVTSCADDGADGTLRRALASAVSGDVVDLTALACSVITLESGALLASADDVTIVGPGPASLTIDAESRDSVIIHAGYGTLTVEGVTLANGSYDADVRFPLGGCVYSTGSVALRDASITTCHLSGINYAYGGAIYAIGDVTIARGSIVGGDVAVTTLGAHAAGGLVFAGSLDADHAELKGGVMHSTYTTLARGGAAYVLGPVQVAYSTVSENIAVPGAGGGLFTRGDVIIGSSTFHTNAADIGAAIEIVRDFTTPTTANVVDSTVSGNVVTTGGSAFETTVALNLFNSTIAFNNAYGDYSTPGGGLLAGVDATDIESTIIAKNTAGGVPSDFTATQLFNLTGSDNLIMVSTDVQPPGTLTADPMLAFLALNGGPTPTHALQPGSPAIEAGNNAAGLASDQRGTGFARVVGAAADIGAFESGNDLIFSDGFE
jgi:hypothetical protein